jgi:hypothetical protein
MYTLDIPPILFRENLDINKVVTMPNLVIMPASCTPLLDRMVDGIIGVWILLLTTNAKTITKPVKKNRNISYYTMLH